MARKTVEIVPTPAGLSGYVAEIGASILGAHLSLPPHHIHDHAAYIGHWMKLLQDDKRAFLAAAAQAQTAVDWLLTKSPVSPEIARPLPEEAVSGEARKASRAPNAIHC